MTVDESSPSPDDKTNNSLPDGLGNTDSEEASTADRDLRNQKIKLFTIGHGNHTLAKFIDLLEKNSINFLVDVRSIPYSKHNPQFNKEDMYFELHDRNIKYLFFGEELGGRPKDAKYFKKKVMPAEEEIDYLHEVDYPMMMKRLSFSTGIKQLLNYASLNSTVVMCSEENPAMCHRHHLIAKYLIENFAEKVEVKHIRGDGTVYDARSIMTSLDKPKVEQPKLF